MISYLTSDDFIITIIIIGLILGLLRFCLAGPGCFIKEEKQND